MGDDADEAQGQQKSKAEDNNDLDVATGALALH
jgi:hypothetical protein